MARPLKGAVIERQRIRDGTPAGVTYALRFSAGGRRRYVTLKVATKREAEEELERTLAAVKLGVWKAPEPAPEPETSEEPTMHRLASDWVARRRHEVDERTVEYWRWALSNHLLPFFADYRPSQVTPALVETYKTALLAEREQRQEALDIWRKAEPEKRGPRPPQPLGNESINKTLKVLAMVLDDAVEFGHLESNPARGKRRRLRTAKPKRSWLEIDQVNALLDAAGTHRPLLATMILAGLRVGELTELRWRDVDLTANTLRIEDAKTEAGIRTVDVSPMLRDLLWDHTQAAEFSGPLDRVFATSNGTARSRSNIARRILQPAVDRANAALEKAGKRQIEHVTNHSLRRTFCALLYEAGATPAYVMEQMGHTDARLALEVYAKVMERKRDTGARMDALLRGAEWAQSGTNGAGELSSLSVSATEVAD